MVRLTRKQQFFLIGVVTLLALIWALTTHPWRASAPPEEGSSYEDEIPEGSEGGGYGPDADGPPPGSEEYPGEWDLDPGGPDDPPEGYDEGPYPDEGETLPRERSL